MNVNIDISENGWTIKVTAISGREFTAVWKQQGQKVNRIYDGLEKEPALDEEFVDVLKENIFCFADIMEAIKKHT